MAQILLLGGDNIEKRVSTMRGKRLPVVVVLAWFAAFTGPVPAESGVVSPDSIPGTTKVDAESVLELAEKNPELVIVDARIRQDRLQGYIEGSISLPDVDTSCESLARIIPRKSTPVLFYCNGPKCGRSVHSSRKALDCGYTGVYWYRGGFEEWKNKNYPYLKK
jgi:rhodanese-related sulfurtransferase